MKILLKFLIIFIIYFFSPDGVLASVNVLPSDIKINNALPGDIYQKNITVTGQEEFVPTVAVVNGDIKDWIEVKNKDIRFSSDESLFYIPVVISIPHGVQSGVYSATLEIKDVGVVADTLNNQEMEISVAVVGFEKGVIIKKVEIAKVNNGSKIPVYLTLVNISEQNKDVNKFSFSVLATDGKVGMSDSVEADLNLKPGAEERIQVEFENDLEVGDYEAVIEANFRDEILADSKTSLSIVSATPRVLGASAFRETYKSEILLIVFAWTVFITTFLVFRNPTFLQLGISIKMIHLVMLMAFVGILGLGFMGGYYISDKLASQNLKFAGYRSISGNKFSGNEGLPVDKYNINFIYNDRSLKLLSKPEDGAEMIYELKEDAELKIIDDAAGWYRVTTNSGPHGWIKIKNLVPVTL